MSININLIAVIAWVLNLVFYALMGYIAWSYKDRDAKKEKRLECVESDVKNIRQEVADKETRYYKDFVTREQHDMDINAILQKLDNINDITREIYKDIGTLIGRAQKDGK